MKKPKIFLASPFFNKEQMALVQAIEAALEAAGFEYWSASKQYDRTRPPPIIASNDDALTVYNKNEAGLDECEVMIAVMNYLLPKNHMLMQMRSEPCCGRMECTCCDDVLKPATPRMAELAKDGKGLEIPDTGTAFEVGYFRAQRKPIVLFRIDGGGSLNLMLTAPVRGVVYGMSRLNLFLAGFHDNDGDHALNWSALEGWSGGHV